MCCGGRWFHGAFTALARSVAASWRALTLIAAFEVERLWLRHGNASIIQPVRLSAFVLQGPPTDMAGGRGWREGEWVDGDLRSVGDTDCAWQVSLAGLAAGIAPIFLVAHNVATLLALFVAWAGKWALMGWRRPGEFDWVCMGQRARACERRVRWR